MICKLKLLSQEFYWKKLRALHALEDLEPLLKIFSTFAGRKSRENYRQIYGKSKASLCRNLSSGTSPNFCQVNPFLCSFSLQLIFFFRTAFLRKFSSRRNFFSLSNSLYEFSLGHSINIFFALIGVHEFFSLNIPLREYIFLYFPRPPT